MARMEGQAQSWLSVVRKTLFGLMGLLVLLGSVGCAGGLSVWGAGEEGAKREAEVALWEAVVRYWYPQPRSETPKLVFVDARSIPGEDPPEEVFASLDDLDVILRPVSEKALWGVVVVDSAAYYTDGERYARFEYQRPETIEVKVSWRSRRSAEVFVTFWRSSWVGAWSHDATWSQGSWWLSKAEFHSGS
jgi:hypothetical protein